MHPRSRLGASLALTTSSACWGLAIVATKGLLETVPPLTALLVQLLASVAFLWGAVAVTQTPVRLDRGALAACLSGVFEPGLAYTVGLLGLSLTTASSASLIGAAETPIVVLMAWRFLGERVGAGAALLACLAAGGVALLMVPDVTGLGAGSLLGDALVLASTFLAAIYVTWSRRLVAGLAPLPLAALQQTAGLLWALAVFGVGRAAGWPAASTAGLTGTTVTLAAASGIVQYALAFWLYLVGLRALPSSRAGVFLTLIPVFGVAGAAVALGERLSPAQWLGAVVVVGAVQAMVRLRSEAPEGSPAEPQADALTPPG